MSTRYRDNLTGRLITKAKWQANPTKRYGGGKRYTREQYNWKNERAKVDGIIIRTGYHGRDDNSYTLVIRMSLLDGETEQDASDRAELATAEGRFDSQGAGDLSWATFHNSYSVIEYEKMPKDTLELITFLREEP
jgi:hypothetical protein